MLDLNPKGQVSEELQNYNCRNQWTFLLMTLRSVAREVLKLLQCAPEERESWPGGSIAMERMNSIL